LQKGKRRRLLKLTEELQGHQIIGLEAGSELVDQVVLTLDQTVLVASQGFEFGDVRVIRFESPQLGKIRSADFCQQVRIGTIRLGPEADRSRSIVLGLTG
jgi:hypothetical protein